MTDSFYSIGFGGTNPQRDLFCLDSSTGSSTEVFIGPNLNVIPPAIPLPPGRWSWWQGSQTRTSDAKAYSPTWLNPGVAAPAIAKGRWKYWEAISFSEPCDSWAYFNALISIPPTPVASYRLIADHYLSTGFYKAGETVTEGKEVPVGWIPTQAVDPVGDVAILAFWNAGPRVSDLAEPNIELYPYEFWYRGVAPPLIYWIPYSPGLFILTGDGAALGPKAPS